MKQIRWSFFLFAVFVAGCAQIRSVEGGPKDNTPPQLVSESTPNGKTHWKDQSLSFQFNEYIQLEDIQNQIIISPNIQPAPTFNVKGKSVIIKWEKALEENTTYTFQFGDAIVDITEGNPTELERAYSTGSFLDSMELHFKVLNGWTEKAADNAVVMLLKKPFDIDSMARIAYQKRATDGKCTFEHLPERSFYIVAFQDNNKDGQWSSEEWLDWIDAPLTSAVHADTIELTLAPNKIKFTSLLHAKVDSIGVAKWYWPLSETPDIKIDPPYHGIPQVVKDTLYYQLNGMPDNDYHMIKVFWGNGESDSLAIPFFKEVIENYRWKKTQADPVLIQEQNPQFFSTFPVQSIRPDRFVWSINENKAKANLSFGNQHLIIQPEDQKTGKYSLTILPQCFTTHGISWPKDTMEITGQIQSKEERGLIQWKLNSNIQSGYYLLTDEKGFTIQSDVKNWSKPMYLNPGKYQLRWIEDRNQDQHWTSHDFKNKIRAERVWVYPDLIQVRANWTQVVDCSKMGED